MPTVPDLSLTTLFGMSAWTIVIVGLALSFGLIYCIVIWRGGTPLSAAKYGALAAFAASFPVPLCNLVLLCAVGWAAWQANDPNEDG